MMRYGRFSAAVSRGLILAAAAGILGPTGGCGGTTSAPEQVQRDPEKEKTRRDGMKQYLEKKKSEPSRKGIPGRSG